MTPPSFYSTRLWCPLNPSYPKQTDNKTANLLIDQENDSRLEQLDPKENTIVGQDSLNIVKIPMNDKEGIRDVIVAILDTGIAHKHEDLNGKVIDEIDFTKSGSPIDYNGHGTHIAGIIAAAADNDLGLIGVAPQAKLLNVKVADDTGMCNSSVVARGIVWAVDNGANVINMSLEMRDPSKELQNAIDYAWENGCIIVAAANLDNQSLVYPAGYDKCIDVTMNRQDNMIIPMLDSGNWVDMAAPGHQIYSTLPHNSYGIKSGASCSTAFVSGIAALSFSTLEDNNGDGKLNDEVRMFIESHRFDLDLDRAGRD
jgi:thermitase